MQASIPECVKTWMADSDNEELLGWDMIVALPLELVNQTLTQRLLQLMSTGDAPSGLSGKIPFAQSPFVHHLERYRLVDPVLSVAASDYVRSGVSVNLSMEEGQQLFTDSSIAEIITHIAHSPLNPHTPSFNMSLALAQTHLRTDWRASSEHKLSLGGGNYEDTQAGRLFETMMRELAEASSLLDLGELQSSDFHPLRRVKHLQVRTQSSIDTPSDEGRARQSLLLFVSFEHGGQGELPTGGMGFPYLAGLDSEGRQQCTVLVSRHLLHRVALAQSLMAKVQDNAFVFEGGDELYEPLSSMTATRGALVLPSGGHRSASGRTTYDIDAIELNVSGGAKPLRLDFSRDRVNQRWQPQCTVSFRYKEWGGAEVARTLEVRPDLEYELQLKGAEKGDDLLEARWTEPSSLRSARDGSDASLEEEISRSIEEYIRLRYLIAVNANSLIHPAEQLLPFLRILDGRGLRWQVGQAPNNLVVVGGFDGAPGAFDITPQTVQVGPGEAFSFSLNSVEMDPQLLEWSVELLPGYDGEPGEFREKGTYVAPQGGPEGAIVRVKVQATDPSSGRRSEALVCVRPPAVLEPLFQRRLLGHGRETETKIVVSAAGVTAFDWELVEWDAEGNRVVRSNDADERLQPDVNDSTTCTLHAPEQVDTATYTIDEVVVSPRGNQAKVQHNFVLNVHMSPALTIEPAAELLPDGSLKLEALAGGSPKRADWAWFGPGEVTAEGVYIPDATSAEQTVLIIATYAIRNSKQHGHIVLPLPLNSFPQVRRAQVLRGRKMRSAALGGTSTPAEAEYKTPQFELSPGNGTSVPPLTDVQFSFPQVQNKLVEWTVKRLEGNADEVGTMKEGRYTSGNAVSGADEVHAVVKVMGAVVAEGTSRIENKANEKPDWTMLEKYSVMAASGGDAELYPNGYQQLVINSVFETDKPASQDELRTMRLFDAQTHQMLPFLEDLNRPEEPEDPEETQLKTPGVRWALTYKKNMYETVGTANLLDDSVVPLADHHTRSVYLQSRAPAQGTVSLYSGFQDKYGSWYYTISESTNKSQVNCAAKTFAVNEREFDFVRERIPGPRGNDSQDFDFQYNTVDYHILKYGTDLAHYYSMEEVDADGKALRVSMVTWESKAKHEIMASFSGLFFIPLAKDGEEPEVPDDIRFDVNLVSLHSWFVTFPGGSVNKDKAPFDGLVLVNHRTDELIYKDIISADLEAEFEAPLILRLRDKQGNLTTLKIEYGGEGVRRRDYFEVLSAVGGEPTS